MIRSGKPKVPLAHIILSGENEGGARRLPHRVEMGDKLPKRSTRRLADSAFTAVLRTPTRCGTGLVGDKASRDGEWWRIVDPAQIFARDFSGRAGNGGAAVLRGAREKVLT